MPTLSISAALSEGWKQFAKRPWYLISVSAAVWCIFALCSSNAVFTALAYIIYGGYLMLLLRHYRGETVKFDDMFSLDSRWISFAFLAVIKTVFIFIGFIFFIIPGIYLAVKWSFADLLVIDKGMKPMEALRASSAMTAGHRWKLFFFGLVAILVALVGLLLLVVGLIPAGIILCFALIHFYSVLSSSTPAA